MSRLIPLILLILTLTTFNFNLTTPIVGESSNESYVIAFDQSHAPAYTIESNGNYSILADFLRSLGYIVKSISSIEYDSLRNVSTLVIATPSIEYSSQEAEVLRVWVENGGSLLILAEWGEYSKPLKELADTFNFRIEGLDRNDMLVDPSQHLVVDGVSYEAWIYVGRSQLNTTSPMLRGVSRLEFYGATSLTLEVGDGSILAFTSKDTKWFYSDAKEAGKPLAVAMTYGDGKIVVIGDSDLFSNQDLDRDGEINLFDSDNEIFAINVFSWLTGGSSYMEHAVLTVTETETLMKTIPSNITETTVISYNYTVTRVETETLREYYTITSTHIETLSTTITETLMKTRTVTKTLREEVPYTTTRTVKVRETGGIDYRLLTIVLVALLVMILAYYVVRAKSTLK